MAARSLPAALAFIAVLADARGRHELAYWLVVAAVPAAAAGALTLFGALAEVAPRTDEEAELRVLTTFAAIAAGLVVLAAAVRSPARLDVTVPALGTSALVAALSLYCLQALVVAGARAPALRLGFARLER